MEKFARLFTLLLMLLLAYLFIFNRGYPFYSWLAIILIASSLFFDYLFSKGNK